MRKLLMTALLATGLIGQVANASPVLWDIASGGNGHYYDFIDSNVTWDTAFKAAQGMTFMGQTGYLATVTSAGENRFASVTVAGSVLAWLGASDAGNEGTFTWRDGPEVGQALTYTNWLPGEPNNCCGGENYLQTNFSVTMGWNDHGGPGNAGQINGFLVEFNAPNNVPEPASLALVMAAALAGVGVARRRGR